MHKIGVSGHRMITEATRRSVAREVTGLLTARDEPVEGWTSLAEGADSVFAWAVLATGGQVVFVQPSDDVALDFEGSARIAFDAARSLVVRTVPLDHRTRSEAAYLEAGRRVVEEVDEMVLVWDGLPAVGTGGTGDIARYCTERGTPFTVVWPDGAARA
jgi:hypothetical protein